MKSKFAWILAVLSLQSPELQVSKLEGIPNPTVQNLFIITLDGFRWQEVFNGADKEILEDCPDQSTLKMLYWAESTEERRRKLLPFFWNVLSVSGRIYGNRQFNNKVDVTNLYRRSYPGYNEIFTGQTDPFIRSNRKMNNPHLNVLEYLNELESFRDNVAVFTSWDVFPFILNRQRSSLNINSGYDLAGPDSAQDMITRVQREGVNEKTSTRYDQLTFITAMDYIKKNRPRVVYLGFGETDEAAHQGRYDLYLEKANRIDNMIAELWHWAQTTPGYKDNTTFLITTDHGRGSRSGKWTDHGAFIRGSSETWLALIGPNIFPEGEMHGGEHIYEKQLASTIAGLVGEKFGTGSPAISLR